MLLHSDALDRALGGEEPLQQFGASNSATSGHGRSNAPPASRDLRIAIPKSVHARGAGAPQIVRTAGMHTCGTTLIYI